MSKENISKIYEEFSVNLDGNALVFFFNSGMCLNRIPSSRPGMHTHYHHELFAVFRGEMRIVTERGIETVTAGETVIIPRGLVHRPEYSDDIFRANMAFLNSDESCASPLDKMLSAVSDRGGIIKYSSPYILEAIDRVLSYYHGDFDYKSTLIGGCLEELAALLCQNGSRGGDEDCKGFSDSRNYRRYIISATFDSAFVTSSYPIVPPTLEELCKRLHLSAKQTERTVKSLYGRTFGEQLLYLKMEKARELLRTTDMTVNKISVAIGYSSTKNFFSAFKKQFGMTPKEYKNRLTVAAERQS